MSGPRWLPTLPQVASETVAVVLGAIAGAIIIQAMPRLKAWLQANYSTPTLADPAARSLDP